MTKTFYFLLAFCLLLFSSFACDKNENELPTDSGHPRILLLKGEEQLIEQSIAANPIWKKMHEAILVECAYIIAKPPVERIQIGRRLLDKSRECLRRVFYLSYAYRMTGQDKYWQRAEQEMLAVANFSDWNPTHFLDVAEMTMGMAIGYDWLYDKLSNESRETIKNAILNKGINPSFDSKYNWFLTANHNWNQVCNAGMTYGALAISEDDPALAKKVIDRALESIHLPMEEYKPDGAYPEGYSYWDYGTSFNVMFLSAIEKAFETDYGLTETPGFLQTANFLQNMTGTTGQCFNWGDCGSTGSMSPSMFWFAQKRNDPSLLWVEKSYLETSDYSKFTKDRLLPAIMIWGQGVSMEQITEPTAKVYTGQGDNPISIMRTSWSDPNGIYLGFKAGSPSVNHGHMDIGSFVMEADGFRWASDLGSQSYESLESKGMSIFGRTQDAQRWTILRMNNYAHNVLIVNNELQQVKGYAKIDRHSANPVFSFAVSDLSTVYEGQLNKFTRGVGIVDQKYVVVRDELKTGAKAATIRWNMLTKADVKITGSNTAELTKDGKKLTLKVQSGSAVQMKTWSTEPTNDYDAPNPGTVLVGFECDLPANTSETFQVLLVPASAGNGASFNLELDNWK